MRVLAGNLREPVILKLVSSLKHDGLLKTVHKVQDRSYWNLKFQLAKTFGSKVLRSKYGPVFKSNFGDGTFTFYIKGSYGDYLANLLREYDKPFVFIDIGVNQGLYSILAAQNPLCKSVFAFEPVSKIYNLLEENLRLNNVNQKTKVFRCAISDVAGEKSIFFKPTHTGESSLEHSEGDGIFEVIKCITYAELNALINGWEDVEIVVKIDTEGHEPTVIDQLRQCIFWTYVNTVFYEVDERWFDNEELFAGLAMDGFEEVWRTSSNVEHYDVCARKNVR